MDPCILQPGTLRHPIAIQASSAERDAAGQQNTVWSTVLSTRAVIESTASQTFRFSFQGNALASNATDLIVIRYPSVEIKPGMQVLFGSDVYSVQAVDDVQRRHRVLNLAVLGQDIGSK